MIRLATAFPGSYDPRSNGSSLVIADDPALDTEILRILDSETPGETIAATFERREVELRVVFRRLDVSQSRALARRLSHRRPADAVSSAFGRLVPERRSRLVAVLEDARRREAIRSAR